MTLVALAVESMDVRFGGVHAVSDVSLSVTKGEALAIVGPNGSGKSTLLNAISGLVRARGKLTVLGRPVPLGNPQRIHRAGVLRAFQTPQCFGELTCLENVLLAEPSRRWTGLTSALLARKQLMKWERARWHKSIAALTAVGLESAAGWMGDELSYGQQRLLEIARCLAGDPTVLLLDEPSAGLNESETRDLAALLRRLRDATPDLSLVIVDHKVGFLESLCDRILVLELGQVIADGSAQEVWANPRVISAYLGWTEADA